MDWTNWMKTEYLLKLYIELWFVDDLYRLKLSTVYVARMESANVMADMTVPDVPAAYLSARVL